MFSIDAYQFGQITINQQKIHCDLVLSGDEIHEGWKRERAHFLQLADLEPYHSPFTTTWIIGTGKFGVLKIAPEVRAYCIQNHIELIVEKTPKAIEAYRKIHSQSNNILGAFHIFC